MDADEGFGTTTSDLSATSISTQAGEQGAHTTRRNPEMEKYVVVAPVVIEGEPDAHNVFLQVGTQRFCVSPHGCDNKEHAEWLRDMLCIALARVVKEATRS